MKKTFTRTLTMVLALLLIVTCLTGCNGGGASTGDFDETAGFTVQVGKPTGVSDEMWNSYLKELETRTDVPITWDIASAADAGAEALNLRFASGDYPDLILGNSLNASAVSDYAASGILLPLDEFINEEDTPNIWKMFEENPTTKGANYLPDGHMYSLPQLIEFEPQYLERVLYINKAWLDKLGLEVPTTVDEVKEVLRAFKTQDPNGNGKADEIPMSFMQGHAFSCPETMLSTWGYSTKSGTYDSYTTVKDGKVLFAPMTDGWKEMIAFYRDLYKDGLLDMEAFTHTAENFTAKLSNPTSTVGMAWAKNNPFQNADEYIAIEPIRVEGIEPVWHIHPGIIGNRNVFSITNACKNPKAVMKWVDHFYSLENSLRLEFGEFGYAINDKNEEGVYTFNEAPEGISLSTYIQENKPIGSTVCYLPEEIFGTTLELNKSQLEQQDNYEIYKKYVTTEPWPRPYYSDEESSTLSVLQTDIFTKVNEQMAKWVVGTEDLEKGWDKYVEDLKAMGVDQLVEINQEAYDRFQKGMK